MLWLVLSNALDVNIRPENTVLHFHTIWYNPFG